MDLSLSEICAMLGDRIEQYNCANRKRRVSIRERVMQAKVAKLRSEKEYKNIFSRKYMLTSTPVQTPNSLKKPQSLAGFSSATKPIQETPKRKVLRVHRKIITNAKRLTFDSEDGDNN